MRTIAELQDMTGQFVVVTGAGGHIGYCICDVLLELGADVLMLDKNESALKQNVAKFSVYYPKTPKVFTCDLEDIEGRDSVIQEIEKHGYEITGLVNNAAFVGDSRLDGWSGPLPEQGIEAWRRSLEVNLIAPFHLSRDISALITDCNKSSGFILNISSIYASYGPDWGLYEDTTLSNPSAYGASKAGLEQLTRWLAATVGPRIRVNAISPGGVQRNQPQKFVDKYIKKVPLSRMATEEDFKGAVAFLCSNLSAYVTGQVLQVNGGWGIR